jgi:hypothetical protein
VKVWSRVRPRDPVGSLREKMSSLKVLFDRSAFHGSRFDLLRAAPIDELRRRDLIEIVHSPILIEETFLAFGSSRDTRWREHLDFLADHCDGIFLHKEHIWHEELVCGLGPFARHLHPLSANRRYASFDQITSAIREKARTGDLSLEWGLSAADRNSDYEKKQRERETSKLIRDEVARKLGELGLRFNYSAYPFEQLRRHCRIEIGIKMMCAVSKRHVPRISAMWASKPDRFPYFSAFIDGYLFSVFVAAARPNSAIEINVQADFEHLSYLSWADMVVSNDAGFFGNAFDTIWRPRGKRRMTAEGFASFVRRLAGKQIG